MEIGVYWRTAVKLKIHGIEAYRWSSQNSVRPVRIETLKRVSERTIGGRNGMRQYDESLTHPQNGRTRKQAPASHSLYGRLHHAAHAAHIGHAIAVRCRRFVCNHRLGCDQQARNRCGVLKGDPNDFGWVDNTGFQHIAVFF